MRRFVMAAAVGLIAAGCAMPIGVPRPSMAVLEQLRDGGLPAMQVGRFAPDASLSKGADRGIGLRAMSISSPVNGSWASYLGETVKANLTAAGKLDGNAPLTVQGLLTKSDVSTGLPNGHAVLGARFSLLKDGKPVFDRELEVETTWTSSFIGAEAIPDASNHFIGLFDQLTLKLLADPDFKAAAKGP